MSFTKLFLELFYLFQKQRYVDFFCNCLRETLCTQTISNSDGCLAVADHSEFCDADFSDFSYFSAADEIIATL